MIYPLALDALLLIIILAIIPIGMYRGGMREVCTSAGLLLGILLAQQWSNRWGDWLATLTGIDGGVSRFLVAVATMVISVAAVGYGAAASFGYRPGPGGRMFGGLLAMANAIVFLGAFIQFVADDLYEGVYPDLIRNAWVSRAISIGFDWVLLIIAILAILGILFGMVVRERELVEDDVSTPTLDPALAVRRAAAAAAASPAAPVPAAPEAAVGSEEVAEEPPAAIKIREVRHWEETIPSTMDELQAGWTRTWPTTVTTSNTSTPRRSGRGRSAEARRATGSDQDLLRDWLADDTNPPGRRPPNDE